MYHYTSITKTEKWSLSKSHSRSEKIGKWEPSWGIYIYSFHVVWKKKEKTCGFKHKKISKSLVL